MIYGNKFLDNSLLLSESLIMKEEENVNQLIKNLSIVSESKDPIDKVYDFAFDKIDELLDRIDYYISKFISFIKVKIVKLGNKILKKLDEVINDKFEVKDLPDIESEFRKDFDNGGEYKEIIESVITESKSEKKVSFVHFKSPKSLIDKSTDYISKDLQMANDFIDIAQNYLDDSVEYLKGNHTDNLKNKIESYSDQFDVKYSQAKTEKKDKSDLTHSLLYDLKEVKSFKGDQNFSTSNGYFDIDFYDISNKEKMKELRSLLFAQIKYLEEQIEKLTKHKNNLKKTRLAIRSFANKSQRVLSNIKPYIDYSIDKFDSVNNEHKTIYISDIKNITSYISRILSDDYKTCVSLINSSIYVTKSNFITSIRAIKYWGENTPKEQ